MPGAVLDVIGCWPPAPTPPLPLQSLGAGPAEGRGGGWEAPQDLCQFSPRDARLAEALGSSEA
jgi:hypothetical protein